MGFLNDIKQIKEKSRTLNNYAYNEVCHAEFNPHDESIIILGPRVGLCYSIKCEEAEALRQSLNILLEDR